METQSIKVDITADATPQGSYLGFFNSVLIKQSQEIEEFLVDENDDGNIMSLGSFPDSSFPDKVSLVRLQDLAPTTVHQLIHSQFNDAVLSRLITDRIVLESRRRDLPRGLLFMKVIVKFTKKDYIVLPSYSAPSTTKVEEPCAICLEDMSESEPLCQLPDCAHVFHEECLVKWLDPQHDSCPLCRQSANLITNKPSTALEQLSQSPNRQTT